MIKENRHPEYQYLDMVSTILEKGTDKEVFFTPEILAEIKKKGEEPPFIRSIFGYMMRFNMEDGFPLLTTKKVFSRGIIHELIWFLRGDSNIKYLVDNDVHIWDEWAWKRYNKLAKVRGLSVLSQDDFIAKLKEEPKDSVFVREWGDLITIYGRMWRRWPASDGREIDQLGWVIEGLKTAPFRKSYVVSAWNPDFIYAMASPENANEVPPFCHTTFQFQLTGKDTLNLGLYQRSADTFLGVPFNIASYALLLHMVAQVTGLKAGEFVHFIGDAHIYSNHFDQMKEQMTRKPRSFPRVKLNEKIRNIDDFTIDDISFLDYDPHPAIKGEIANIGGFIRVDTKERKEEKHSK